MSRISIPARDDAHADAKPVLDNVHKLLGFVPNLHRLMSNNPNVLNGWAQLQANLAKTLDVKTRDAIALAVSQVDGCDYCLAAHTYVASNFAKLSPEEIAHNRKGHSLDAKRAAAAAFARDLVEHRGNVSDKDLESVRAAGYSDGDIVAIIGLCAQYLMTNFMNNAAQTPIDFPHVEPATSAA
jgi:uncharacterized peroxidase-related enzyme